MVVGNSSDDTALGSNSDVVRVCRLVVVVMWPTCLGVRLVTESGGAQTVGFRNLLV